MYILPDSTLLIHFSINISLGAALHSLVSESFFLVEIMLHDIHGNAKPCENVVTYGYSFKGIILANIIGVLLVTAAIVCCFWSAPLQVSHALGTSLQCCHQRCV